MAESVNTDPTVSPRRNPEPNVLVKPASTDSLRHVRSKTEFSRSMEPCTIVIPSSLDLPPTTPAGSKFDLFSPSSTYASTGPLHISQDTPPPGELSVGQESARPSRRQRSSVSYAEPNLRAKMRRPTKELVDAVQGEGKTKSIAKTESDGEGTGPENTLRSTMRTVTIKRDESGLESHKDRDDREQGALSPLSTKSTISGAPKDQSLPTSVMTARKKRTSNAYRSSPSDGSLGLGPASDDVSTSTSGSRATISALVSGTTDKKNIAKLEPTKNKVNSENIATLQEKLCVPQSGNDKVARVTRRFSSAPQMSDLTNATELDEGKEHDDTYRSEQGHYQEKSQSARGGSSVLDQKNADPDQDEKRSHMSRDRGASRRRSMML